MPFSIVVLSNSPKSSVVSGSGPVHLRVHGIRARGPDQHGFRHPDAQELALDEERIQMEFTLF